MENSIPTDEQLMNMALEAKERAYAPYSGFRVGAALLTERGTVFTGCNVENCSYGLTNCAERSALFAAVSQGSRLFKKIVIVSDGPKPATPCGACRQVLVEFAPELEIISISENGTTIKTNLKELLPQPFTRQTLAENLEDN